jgi:hypothetical protein
MRIARRERIHCSCGSFIRANGEQRVAIWWRTHDGLSSDIAAGARPVLNDELLTELLGEPLTYYARDDVNRLARGKSDDDAHRQRRIRLQRLATGRPYLCLNFARSTIRRISVLESTLSMSLK